MPPTPASQPPAGVALFVRRPFQAVPEPDEFIQGALVSLTEEVVRSGYDYLGLTLDPAGEEAVLEALERHNEVRPGTAAVHLVFIEAPSLVGFGPTYTTIDCVVFGPQGQVLLRTHLPPPARRSLVDLVLPPRQPEVDGRYWAARMWAEHLAAVLPPRG